jgi:hypothetical protein
VPSKRLCYFTSQRVTAFLSKGGALSKEAVFGMNQAGIREFAKYVAGAKGSMFSVLVDVVEEDFFQENIPWVHGADRRGLLSRKVAQRYRDASLAIPISLGSETHAGRREERILFTSLTNTQLLQPWIETLRSGNARVAGIFSVALAAAATVRRLGFKKGRYLMVSLQQAGLRQSYVENGRIRFSRLSRVSSSDPRVIAQDCATESARIYQYLLNTRILPREAAALDVLVLAPSEHVALYEAACVGSSRLQYYVNDLDKVARKLGLKSAPVETLAEGLFLHILANDPPREQFADDAVRRFYDLWRAKMGLIAGGAAVCGACLLYAGVTFFDIRRTDDQAANDRRIEAQLAAQYARLQAAFPKTPTSSDNLKDIVKNYRALLAQTGSPRDMFVSISQAVTAVPQIEIDRIDWESSAAKAADARSSGPVRPPPTEGTPPPLAETSLVSGRLDLARASDYRAVTKFIDEFTGELRKQPGIEVDRTQLPFDINAEKSISGDIGAAQGQEIPRFTVSLSRRRKS